MENGKEETMINGMVCAEESPLVVVLRREQELKQAVRDLLAHRAGLATVVSDPDRYREWLETSERLHARAGELADWQPDMQPPVFQAGDLCRVQTYSGRLRVGRYLCDGKGLYYDGTEKRRYGRIGLAFPSQPGDERAWGLPSDSDVKSMCREMEALAAVTASEEAAETAQEASDRG